MARIVHLLIRGPDIETQKNSEGEPTLRHTIGIEAQQPAQIEVCRQVELVESGRPIDVWGPIPSFKLDAQSIGLLWCSQGTGHSQNCHYKKNRFSHFAHLPGILPQLLIV